VINDRRTGILELAPPFVREKWSAEMGAAGQRAGIQREQEKRPVGAMRDPDVLRRVRDRFQDRPDNGCMPAFLGTDGLVLRGFTEDDVGHLCHLNSDRDLMWFLVSGECRPP
jgi:hypothetical protein